MHGNELIHEVTRLIIQLGIIIFASWASVQVTNKFRMPAVVGYIFVGVIFGPFILGSVPIPGFHEGIFPRTESEIPVSPVLYSYSSLASLFLLYLSGLETDVSLFVRYIFKGTIVGIGGLLFSFAGGYIVSVVLLDYPPTHPVHLFLGTIATATSVGITTSVLSYRQKISSPEGVTILAAAVMDDVLGIIVLAIVLGLADTLVSSSALDAGLFLEVAFISLKAIGLWIGFTLIGIVFSRKLGKSMKKIFKDATTITVISLALAFFLGGLFEIMGLSMVIGAYIVGLTFSNTDLSYVIQEKIHTIGFFFIPIFFVITGMTINLPDIMQWNTLIFGTVYALVCIVSKVIGGGLPALFLGFTPMGSLRVGFGMAPRGEIALIIASLAMGVGYIDNSILGGILIMIIISSTVPPFVLDRLLISPHRGVLHKENDNLTTTEFDFKTPSLTRLILSDFLQLIEEEKFFINRIVRPEKSVYHIRKDNIFITLTAMNTKFVFQTEQESLPFVKTALYEASANIAESAQTMKNTIDPKNVVSSETSSNTDVNIQEYMSPALVSLGLQENTKEGILREMTDMLYQLDLLKDKEEFINELIEREKSFSTGMQDGVALPHVKTNNVSKTTIAVGLKPEGMDYDSLDGKPSKIFILIASKIGDAHLAILAQISAQLNSEEFRENLLQVEKKSDVVQLFSQKVKSS